MIAQIGTPERPHRVAIIGAGPAGFYAADALLRVEDHEVRVDLFDRSPAPFGLVRYGVAPDHPRIKSVARAYERTLDDPRVRFWGNIAYGRELDLDTLRDWYDDVIFCVGAAADRRLSIAGEDFEGSWSATEFVGWYNADPAFADRRFPLDRIERAVVVGVGNVALDVARVLARPAADLEATDIGRAALDVLRRSAVREVVVIGRRGPAQARFSPSELRELSELPGVSVVWPAGERELDPVTAAWLDGVDDKNPHKNLERLRALPTEPRDGDRVVTLRFRLCPKEILGDGDRRVRGMVVEHTKLVDAPSEPRPVLGGPREVIPAQAVFRSIGYRGVSLCGLPFDDRSGTVPNREGRVIEPESGEAISNLYVAGWIKRGPSGLIGTNRACAIETVQALLGDVWSAEVEVHPEWERRSDAWARSLAPDVFDTARWRRLDAAELLRGREVGAERVKAARLEEMLAFAPRADG